MGCKVKFVILIFFKKSLREEKVFKNFSQTRGVLRTQSNFYDGAFFAKINDF